MLVSRCGQSLYSYLKVGAFDQMSNSEQQTLCAHWTTLTSMITPRYRFGADSGPDQNSAGSIQVNGDPRVYVVGGLDTNKQSTSSCEKYNPNTDTWSPISPLPQPLGNCSAVFVPDSGKEQAQNVGYIYVAGGETSTMFRYDIRNDMWTTTALPFAPVSSTLIYLDDFGGPLVALFIALSGVEIPSCTDTETLWSIGGVGTERHTWFIEINANGELAGNWTRGPDLPLFRHSPLVGRVFWRDAGITSYGVSNCASILVAGGKNKAGCESLEAQLLVRDSNCNWAWISPRHNPTNIPKSLLTLAFPVSRGATCTEQWPETLVTGGRPILLGGKPKLDKNGSTQFAQVRFSEGRYRRDQYLYPGLTRKKTAWNITSSMPGPRTDFRAAPLSQVNSSDFGGRRVSRFLCMGGRDSDKTVLSRVQLLQLPVPQVFPLVAVTGSVGKETDSRSHCCTKC